MVDYVAGRLIGAAPSPRSKRVIMLVSVTVNLVFLATFKYLGFFVREAAELLQAMGFQANLPVLEIVLPIGISFYTFQTIGYIVDVYRGKCRPSAICSTTRSTSLSSRSSSQVRSKERRTCFPSFSASATGADGVRIRTATRRVGPIQEDCHCGQPRAIRRRRLRRSLGLCGQSPGDGDDIFCLPDLCDFSGYTDTARGVARMLGFEIVRNFDHPYFSRTPVEFWRRWHISLSQWFQDYLYYPLAMRYLRQAAGRASTRRTSLQ